MKILATMALALALAGTVYAEPAGIVQKPLVIAHRGWSYVAPENTLASARLGWESGAKAVEIDVWLTADGRVALMHDNTLKRTTGVDRPISSVTACELVGLDAGSWKSPRFAGEPVPMLENILAAIPPGRQLVIEIKSGPETVAPVKALIAASGKASQCLVISFSKDVCLEVVRLMPGTPVYWLLGAPKAKEGEGYDPIPLERVAEAKAAGFTGINVSHHGVAPSLVAACREAGLPLLAWTVNDPARARLLVDMGVEAITTDRPDIILAELHPKP
jgi:glycerophosphoryl diester phosphodiesterase